MCAGEDTHASEGTTRNMPANPGSAILDFQKKPVKSTVSNGGFLKLSQSARFFFFLRLRFPAEILGVTFGHIFTFYAAVHGVYTVYTRFVV